MSVLSHSDTKLGPLLGSPLSPIKSPKAAEPGSCQPGSVAELGLNENRALSVGTHAARVKCCVGSMHHSKSASVRKY